MRLIIEDLKHLKLKENLLWLGTSTLVTVIIWIVFAIYSAYTKVQLDPEVQSLLKPFNPSLDQTALKLVSDQYLPDINIIPSDIPEPIPTEASVDFN